MSVRPASQPATIDPSRTVAADLLTAVRERGAYANLVLPSLIRTAGLTGRDAAFATELGYGATRAQGTLDAVIAAAAGRPVADIDPPVLDVLRLGAYQLLRTRVDAHAAVDTSVELSKQRSGPRSSGFVNAVLRTISRKSYDEWVTELAPNPAEDMVGYLAFQYNQPRWIADKLRAALLSNTIDSIGEFAALLAAIDERPLVHLVARPGEISAEELALIVGGTVGLVSPYAVYLPGGDPGALEPVRDRLAAVQDEGSQLVARAAVEAETTGTSTGRWLDLCAGPGGKAALLGAFAALDGAQVDAVEPAAHRAELVRKAVVGLPVSVHVADGRSSDLPRGGYDRVLVDAPCSGLGALRRRPEARWRKSPDDIAALATLQRELLVAAADLVRPGGVVLYATCSPAVEETTQVTAAAPENLMPIDTRPLVPDAGFDLGAGPHVQLWPHQQGTDAMFIQVFRRH